MWEGECLHDDFTHYKYEQLNKWWGSGMIFARPCRHFDGLLGKKYTYSGFYWECEKKGVPVLEFEDV